MSSPLADKSAPASPGQRGTMLLNGVANIFTGDISAVSQVDLEIKSGWSFMLPASHGCGKTLAPCMIAGFETTYDPRKIQAFQENLD